MRIKQQIKSTKSKCKHKVRKKRHKSKSTLGCTPGVSILDLENINEVLRVNRIHIRNQRAGDRRPWKVVPKDSFEVYKDRRKRQAASRRKDERDDGLHDDNDHSSGRRQQKRRNGRKCRKAAAKKTTKRRNTPLRCGDHSSMSSTTTATTSNMSSSEMDYE